MNEQLPIDFPARFRPVYLVELIWRRRLIVAGTVALGILIAILLAATTTPVYVSHMVVGPADDLNSSSQLSGLSQVASLAGVNLSTPGSSDMQEYKILLTGTLVAAEMEKRFGTLRELIPQAWNAKASRWKRRDEVAMGPKEVIKSLLGLYRWQDPGPVTLSEILQKYVVFADVRKSPFVEVRYRSKNPEQGMVMLQHLHEVTSAIYAQDLATRAQAQISYIASLLRTEQRTSVRDSLIRNLDQYTNKVIMFESGQQLLVQLIQPPVSSSNPIWPKPSLMIVLGAIFGLIAGVVVTVFWTTNESFNTALRSRIQGDVSRLNKEIQRWRRKRRSKG